MSADFNPFDIFQWPLSGNVNQRIASPWFSPAMTFNFAGDAAVEERVVKEVASYGKQLGCLNDIVLALARNGEPTPEAVDELATIVKDVADIKTRMKQSKLDKAVAALDQLSATQPDAYAALIRERSSRI